MISEERICQNCKNDFTIEPDDFSFYEKIKVSPPTWCPDCRQQRRYAWRNEKVLYRRNCDLCGKSTVTIYSPDKPYKVYCLPCWWGDGWDMGEYGRDFDFSRPFFEQFAELQRQVPRMALLNKNSQNSEYTNHSGENKNTYLSFSCFDDENVMYSTWLQKSRDCMDSTYVYEKGERLYECTDCRSSYQCQYCVLVKDSSNCYYCYDCTGCSDCFLSSNLRSKRYVFKNKQCTKEEYLENVKNYNLASFTVRENLNKEFEDLLLNTSIHKFMTGERNVVSKGNMLFNSKNAQNAFDADKLEDTKYMYSGLEIKDSMDLYHVGYKVELCYECHGCVRIYDTKFCHLCYDNSGISYCDSCQNSQNLFGCVSVKKGEYMIFNKKYSKEEYNELKNKIIEHMKQTGEYGEFFPPQIAPVYYNETRGNFYVPMKKEDVLAKGWHWEDKIPGTFGKETITIDQIPDTIQEVGDDMLKQILKCQNCTKNYNIVFDELAFYRQESIPLPRRCPTCRDDRRFALRQPRKLWHRKCMNESCTNAFETSYAPDRPEKVFCESCYQKEVY